MSDDRRQPFESRRRAWSVMPAWSAWSAWFAWSACAFAAIACGHGGDAAFKEPAAAGAIAASSPTAQPSQVAPPQTKPVFELDPPIARLGVLEPNEERELDVAVRNVSGRPFKIEAIVTGCKCVAIDFDRKEIAPGAAGVVHVKVSAPPAGARRATATIQTSDPQRTKAVFTVEYSVVPEVLTQPRKVDFGKVGVGEKAEVTLKVTIHLPKEIVSDPLPEPFVQHDLPIRVTIDPPTITRLSDDFRDLVTTLHLVLDTSKPIASFESALIFRPKAERTFRETTLRILGEVRGGIWFEHPKLAFGAVTVGTPTTKSIRLHFDGTTPPAVAEVVVSPDEFTEKHEVEAADRCIRFDITCSPKAAGVLGGRLLVKVTPSAEPLELPLAANGR